MKKPLPFTILLLFYTFSINAQKLIDLEKNRIELPHSWSLTPIGISLNLGDLPLNMAVSSSKKYIAVTNNGQSKQCIQIIDVNKKKIVLFNKTHTQSSKTKQEKRGIINEVKNTFT